MLARILAVFDFRNLQGDPEDRWQTPTEEHRSTEKYPDKALNEPSTQPISKINRSLLFTSDQHAPVFQSEQVQFSMGMSLKSCLHACTLHHRIFVSSFSRN
jgi:hypothetical protein